MGVPRSSKRVMIRNRRRADISVSDNSLDNRTIAELLAKSGEEAEGYARKAFFRAAHEAFRWPEEAALLVQEERSLTELPAVGPFLAKTILAWIQNPPEESPIAPPIRRNFLTMSRAHQVLAAHPAARSNLKGDLQMHTQWSDGSASIRDMAEAGIARGYNYIGVTDHTKGLK